jgi:hypothetical protein
MLNAVPFESLQLTQFGAGLWSNRSPLFAPPTGALLDGSNAEISEKLTLKRRAGLSKYSTQQLTANEIPREFFSYRDLSGSLRVLADLTDKVATVTSSTVTSIFATTASTVPFSFEQVGSDLYFANGTDAKRYNGTNVFDIGVTAPSTAPTFSEVANLRFAGAGAGTNWTNPGNITAYDSNLATYNNTTQDWLRATSFGFSLPAGANILGIEVRIIGSAPDPDAVDRMIKVALTKDGTTPATAATNSVVLNNTIETTAILGRHDDLWGTTWTKAEVESANFGVLIADNDTTAAELRINSVQVRITHDKGLRGTRGYRWRYVYKTADGHRSSASPASACSNSINAVVTVEGARSTDPQVTTVEIYRILDGGAVYFLVGEVANPVSGTWTFDDAVADAAVTKSRIAAIANENDPPPTGIDNLVFHLGRLWGSVGNKVYYSGGGEITNGIPERAWKPTNYFVFPGTVTSLQPHALGLAVFTSSRAYLIRGIGPSTFFAMPWLDKVGVRHKRAATSDGETIYAFTSDKRLLSIAQNGLTDLGFVIQDKLNALNPTTAIVTQHAGEVDGGALYVADGSTGYYRFSLLTQNWSPKASITNGFGMVRSVETGDGTFSLLAGRTTGSGYILKRDTAVSVDDGSTFSWSFDIGSLTIAPPGKLAEAWAVNYEANTAGSVPTVSVRFNELAGSFAQLGSPENDPPELEESASFRSKRWYTSTAADATLARHVQLRFEFPAEDAATEVYSIGLIGRQ